MNTHKDILQARYKDLLPTRNNINDPVKEAEWNELARLFVQRFQQIHNMPFDSLAGMRTFERLEATAVGSQVKRGDPLNDPLYEPAED